MPFDGATYREESQELRVLREARRLIAEGWCQRAMAVGQGGELVTPGSPHAARFCAVGAVTRATITEFQRTRTGTLLRPSLVHSRLQKKLDEREGDDGRRLEAWNDDRARTHEDVLALFDAALEDAQREAVDAL